MIQALPGEIKAAMIMSDVERSSFTGEGSLKQPKGALAFTDGSHFDISMEGYSEPAETDLRNWLKGIRDSGYECSSDVNIACWILSVFIEFSILFFP